MDKAIKEGNLTIIREGIDKDPTCINDVIDEEENTLLLLATKNDKLGIVKYLIDKGANTKAININGDNSIMVAVKKRSYGPVILLARAGENMDIEDTYGDTLLSNAIITYEDGGEMIKLLLKLGSDVNKENRYGDTPLITAIQHRKVHRGHGLLVIKLLIEAGADVNYISGQKHTPLIIAAQNGDHMVVDILLEAGVNLNIDDFITKRTLEIAKGKCLQLITEKLKPYQLLSFMKGQKSANVDSPLRHLVAMDDIVEMMSRNKRAGGKKTSRKKASRRKKKAIRKNKSSRRKNKSSRRKQTREK